MNSQMSREELHDLVGKVVSGELPKSEASRLTRKQIADEDNLLNAELRDLQKQSAHLNGDLAGIEEIEAWVKSGPLVLEPNQHSRIHHLQHAMREGRIIGWKGVANSGAAKLLDDARVFVVRHDWEAALGPAISESDGDVRLPFPECVFEFMVSGRCMILWACQLDGEQPKCAPFVHCGDRWYSGGEADGTRLAMPWRQVHALCIALDAEVATHEVIRAPEALNKKRLRNGKPLLKDFHVIDLAKRHRVTPSVPSGNYTPKRLHFRRGHWRHFETHKTWIKWMLVGNPDLGFVDKHYRI